jgi:CelD/BcsL family acetyltransferase involved in cellulose biosynthesis
MVATPILEEMSGSPAGAMISDLAGLHVGPIDPARIELLGSRRPPRKLAIYPASAGFDLVEELDHLSARTVEPNVFFNPRFLAPAMPRLEDREVRLAIIRDGDDQGRSRLRFLAPFSVERPAMGIGAAVMRMWSSPFGPLGTPLIDRDDPLDVIDDLFSMLARPHLRLPRVVVLPDIPLNGPVADLLRVFAASRDLALITAEARERPFLKGGSDPETYLRQALSAHHYRGFNRLRRRLAEQGALAYKVSRRPDEIRSDVEIFLTLEASGWKGRERSAMVADRFRAAFAREAIHGLAERDLCRIHSLTLDGRTIACLIVFVEAGVAYTWKTAYDEAFAPYSPGALLMMDVTRTHLDDPNIDRTDSCAVPDHPVMSRIWTDRTTIGTMVLALTPQADHAARQAARQLHLYRETRNIARIVRRRMKELVKRR